MGPTHKSGKPTPTLPAGHATLALSGATCSMSLTFLVSHPRRKNPWDWFARSSDDMLNWSTLSDTVLNLGFTLMCGTYTLQHVARWSTILTILAYRRHRVKLVAATRAV